MEDGFLIILEGPDRTGKSTIAAAIQERTGAEVIHAGVPTQSPFDEYVEPLLGVNEFHTVLDRWHLGQYVYPRVYPEGRTPITDHELLFTEMFLLSRGAVLLNTWDMPWRIAERVQKDKDSYLKEEDVVKTSELFFTAFTLSILPKQRVNFRNFEVEPVLEWSREMYAKRANYWSHDWTPEKWRLHGHTN